MIKILNLLMIVSALAVTTITHGQSNKQQALAKAEQALKLEDENGQYDEAISLLSQAQALDPDNIAYPYEISYAYIGKKDYKKASDILEKLLTHKDVHARVYQTLGNAYDEQGKPDKAIAIYEEGLKKFPNSGELYLELGNMKLNKKDYNAALGYYEQGIEKDPKFPSDYYWTAKLFCSSEEEVWGMVYGEIFMNLERNSKRTAEISKLLFDTYKSEMKFTSDTSFSVSFSKSTIVDAKDFKDPKKFKLPFGTGCYEMVLLMATLGSNHIDINSLDKIRTNFLDGYYKNDNATRYPNILFDYQRKIKSAGHFEAYNHWLLMKGDEDGFESWVKSNKSKFDAFVKWFRDNPMQVDQAHKFYRNQY